MSKAVIHVTFQVAIVLATFVAGFIAGGARERVIDPGGLTINFHNGSVPVRANVAIAIARDDDSPREEVATQDDEFFFAPGQTGRMMIFAPPPVPQ